MRFMFLLVVLLVVPSPSEGATKHSALDRKVRQKVAEQYDFLPYLKTVCDQYLVPFNLMRAVIEQEASSHPWTVNIEGKSYYFASKDEAVELIYQNLGRSFDVGLGQINVQWLKKYRIKPEDALDPFVSIQLATFIMNENLIAYGPTWKAVAAYHTPPGKNPIRAADYAKKVWARYQKFEVADKKVKEDKG